MTDEETRQISYIILLHLDTLHGFCEELFFLMLPADGQTDARK